MTIIILLVTVAGCILRYIGRLLNGALVSYIVVE